MFIIYKKGKKECRNKGIRRYLDFVTSKRILVGKRERMSIFTMKILKKHDYVDKKMKW